MADQISLAEMTIAEVLTRWPEAAEVIRNNSMACIGCPVALFCTIADVADNYDMGVEELLAQLHQVLDERVEEGRF